ncbi:ImmA/IrrE family metallo-endopeptidase [Microbacterium allomyrinae]|uniref:ImmA/IrrE family metallo-endopeptidase n=1 Tax=Microbacterium allomyrinae TaxID=2830666 RepID=A0A9X1S2U6_9MICO|nr:ImmA/IrrE family metallo-endopeptidase [Microbacterium allomyrinae]MCC2031797.1 ImmA/IrrE family metallo-endopeptidase [Microbacterium allomyrinae]
MQALLQLAAELGVTVIEKRATHCSGYRADERLIRLSPGMKRRSARSVLAHELGHHILGHRPTEFGPIRKRQEREANEWAALHLIDHAKYVEVERIRDGHLESMAFDLDVATELLTVFRSMLHRIGDATYLDPRMGAGQWLLRTEVV